MSGHGVWAVQIAIFDALQTAFGASPTLLGADPDGGQGIYDEVPQNVTFPYIVIGESTAEESDTKDTLGQVHFTTLHVWSRYPGKKELKEIMQVIYDALHNVTLAATGQHVILTYVPFEQTLLDPDNKTRHGVQRVRTETREDTS